MEGGHTVLRAEAQTEAAIRPAAQRDDNLVVAEWGHCAGGVAALAAGGRAHAEGEASTYSRGHELGAAEIEHRVVATAKGVWAGSAGAEDGRRGRAGDAATAARRRRRAKLLKCVLEEAPHLLDKALAGASGPSAILRLLPLGARLLGDTPETHLGEQGGGRGGGGR